MAKYKLINNLLGIDTSLAVGIDVSRWQDGWYDDNDKNRSTIDWEKVADYVDYVFIKATEYVKDPEFDYNWSACKSLGIPRSGYSFFHPEKDSGLIKNRAQYFANVTSDAEMTNVLDVEVDDGKSVECITSSLLTFTTEYEISAASIRKSNIALGYYTSPGFWNVFVSKNNWAGKRLLFNAAWTTAKYPLLPRDWNNFAFWQKAISEKGAIPGISNKVDLGLYNGTPAQLKTWIQNGCAMTIPPPDTEIEIGKCVIVIAEPGLIVRSGPGTNYSIFGSVPKGKKLEVLGVDYDEYGRTWYKIEYNSKVSYCAAWYTEPFNQDVPSEKDEYIKITANPRLNLRSGPNTIYNVLGTANMGDIFLVQGTSFDNYNRLWYKLLWNNKVVYAAGWYCEKVTI